MRQLLVTGGLGFIGAAFVRRAIGRGLRPVVIDLDTYAGDERRLADVAGGYDLVRADVASAECAEAIARLAPSAIVHLAAESHVTRGESAVETFFRVNVRGTETVLKAAEAAGCDLVIHVSTDEVYGSCDGPPFTEADKEPGEGRATSVYARSKAVADDAAQASSRVPVIVVRPTNCFGAWQYPEKAVARWSVRALSGGRMPVWGDGGHVRDWMHVEDACAALERVIEGGSPGEVYNIAPEGSQRTNLEIATAVARAAGRDESAVYLTAYDRPDHDRRYAIDASKVRALGWSPTADFDDRLRETVAWYEANPAWWRPLVDDAEGLYADAAERLP